MKSYISILYIQTNSLAAEKVAIGLLAFNDKFVHFHVSQNKLKVVNKLASLEAVKHAELTFDLIQNKIDETIKSNKNNSLFIQKSIFNIEYIKYLNKYSKGLIQFSEPKSIASSIDKKTFKELFKQFIGEWGEDGEKKSTPKHSIISTVNKQLKKEVFKKKADIHYQLKPEKIEGIYSPCEVTLIAKNGALLVGQVIDFNTHEETISKHLYEYEVLTIALKEFSKKYLNSTGKGSYIIIAEEPSLNSPQHKIFEKVAFHKTDLFSIKHPEELSNIADNLEEKNYSKFSEFEKTIA
ncbi:MAG: hypothetical protein EKK37_08610 [Sphingobacteriales bacterium]|nr:MAG: hypothetical protein EKK37_08610 [Sphingobacteriales bacterium]